MRISRPPAVGGLALPGQDSTVVDATIEMRPHPRPWSGSITMTSSNPSDPGRHEQSATDRGPVEGAKRRVRRLLDHPTVGTVALLAGGGLLAGALRSTGRRRRAIQALAGVSLLAVGIRQRLGLGGESGTGRETGRDGGGSSGGIDTAARTAHAVDETTTPRDVTQDPDIDATGDDDGPVQFTTDPDSEARDAPADEGVSGETDSRQSDETDGVTVDISKTAMADEPNEATGPQPEQAAPATTERTEPEPSPPENASHMQADEPETDVPTEETDGDDGEDGSTADQQGDGR